MIRAGKVQFQQGTTLLLQALPPKALCGYSREKNHQYRDYRVGSKELCRNFCVFSLHATDAPQLPSAIPWV